MVTIDRSAAELADEFAVFNRALSALESVVDVLHALTRFAVDQVAGAQYAGVTRGREGVFRTVGETDEIVSRVDAIQYDLRSGPCVDAVVESDIFNSPDLRADTRWHSFGARAAEKTGVLSMLSFRLFFESDHGGSAALNVYSCEVGAFDAGSEQSGLLLASAGAAAIAAAEARSRANNLEQALASSREIGIAIGVLMSQQKVTREQAFDLLRVASQWSHRKVADLARDVADTGVLPDLPSGGGPAPVS